MDPTSTEELNTTGEECSKRQKKLVKALLCISHGNAEVESSQSANSKVLTSE